MKARRSLVLITVDCLRADHAGFLGYDRPTTPFLDSLAGDSLVVPNAVVGGAPTYYSFPAILASRYPLGLGRDVIGLAPDEPNLASVLRQAGYATAAFVAANPYLSSQFGYEQGFGTFQDFLGDEIAPLSDGDTGGRHEAGLLGRLNQKLEKLSRTLGPVGALYTGLYFQYCQRLATPRPQSLDALRRFPAADVLVDQARAWLASVGEGPFFLWLHFMDPHSPYYPAQKALELMGQGGLTPFQARYVNSWWNRGDLDAKRLARHRQEVVALYDAGIRWVDTQVARLLETLRRFRLWDNCVFAFTGDHGEEFLDHGGRYHPPARPAEELIRVPLLLRVPGVTGREMAKSPFSLLHLAPTLLETMELGAPPNFQGRSYWPRLQRGENWDEPAVVECVASCTNPFRAGNRLGPRVLTIREARYKLVLHFQPPGEELFDLETDPAERAPLPPEAERAVRRRLLDRARQHLQHSLQERDEGRRASTRLRQLQLEWAQSASRISSLRQG